MKVSLTVVALLLSLITSVPTVTGQTCSCKATDASCEASVTCGRGCGAICAPKDACYAACGNFEADLLHVRITLKINRGDSKEIASKLTSQTGKKIEFIPKNVNETVTLDLKDSTLFYALNLLSQRGRVTVNGTDFEKFQKIRALMLRDGKVSINFNNVPVKDAVDKLSFLSGLPFRVVSGDAEGLVSISLQEVTLSEIIDRISEKTGVKIEQTRKRASLK